MAIMSKARRLELLGPHPPILPQPSPFQPRGPNSACISRNGRRKPKDEDKYKTLNTVPRAKVVVRSQSVLNGNLSFRHSQYDDIKFFFGKGGHKAKLLDDIDEVKQINFYNEAQD